LPPWRQCATRIDAGIFSMPTSRCRLPTSLYKEFLHKFMRRELSPALAMRVKWIHFPAVMCNCGKARGASFEKGAADCRET
jgi:hypothetical protein